MAKERITGDMNGMQMIMVMAGGNPGALRVVMELMTKGGDIDPDSALGGMGCVLGLDTHKIYEDKIWMLYKDICGHDLTSVVGLLRGVQLGIMSESELTKAINHPSGYGQMAEERIADVLKQVRAQLPNFGK